MLEDVVRGITRSDEEAMFKRTTDKKYSNLEFQCNILCFCLRGEIQKFGERINREQKETFERICDRIDAVIRLARSAEVDLSVRL